MIYYLEESRLYHNIQLVVEGAQALRDITGIDYSDVVFDLMEYEGIL